MDKGAERYLKEDESEMDKGAERYLKGNEE